MLYWWLTIEEYSLHLPFTATRAGGTLELLVPCSLSGLVQWLRAIDQASDVQSPGRLPQQELCHQAILCDV